MSGLNASLGYFLACVVLTASLRAPLKRCPRLAFLSELSSSFMLVACRLEVQTIVEVGEWAGGLGPDVTMTILFAVLLVHGIVCGDHLGNPSVSILRFLQVDATLLTTVLAVASHFIGAFLAILAAEYYWNLELTDMHMIKNLMSSECSTSLLVSPVQGFFTEVVCGLLFYLAHLSLRGRSAFLKVPVGAVLLTFLSHIAKSYTSSYINPSLAYGLTFNCSGFTLTEYALVYWLAPITGMTLALFLYMGHIPRIFTKNLLYKTRFRVRKRGEKEKKK
ncbi:aquaporin 12 isoform X2 [Syngnathus scovelli]|uniref:aquaporin 12 isoform X2 n=1 Tax=Syngnathus scovelli TaxID=161590 RepID=UPI002110647E|nr:aquaporin 12 isoform X2 [Syngnathus scovelli]